MITNPLNDFIKQNESVIFFILGMLIPWVLNYIQKFTLNRHKFMIRIKEKMIGKRIEANDQLSTISTDFVSGEIMHEPVKNNATVIFPKLFLTKISYYEWRDIWVKKISNIERYLTTRNRILVREIEFYSRDVTPIIDQAQTEYQIRKIGSYLQPDLLRFAHEIDKEVISCISEPNKLLEVRKKFLTNEKISQNMKRHNKMKLYSKKEIFSLVKEIGLDKKILSHINFSN